MIRPGCASCHATLEPLAAYLTRVEEMTWTYLPAERFPIENPVCKLNAEGKTGQSCQRFYDPVFSSRERGVLRGAYASADHAERGPAGACGQHHAHAGVRVVRGRARHRVVPGAAAARGGRGAARRAARAVRVARLPDAAAGRGDRPLAGVCAREQRAACAERGRGGEGAGGGERGGAAKGGAGERGRRDARRGGAVMQGRGRARPGGRGPSPSLAWPRWPRWPARAARRRRLRRGLAPLRETGRVAQSRARSRICGLSTRHTRGPISGSSAACARRGRAPRAGTTRRRCSTPGATTSRRSGSPITA